MEKDNDAIEVEETQAHIDNHDRDVEALSEDLEEYEIELEVGDLLYRRRQVDKIFEDGYANYGPLTAVLSVSGDYVWVEAFDNSEIGGFPLKDMSTPEIQESLDGFLDEADRMVTLR